jgi:hypothetical protein
MQQAYEGKLQQASKGKNFYFLLACPCICKHLCLKDVEAYRVVVGASYTLNISFKHTISDYLDAEHPLKPLEKSLMKLQKNFHNNN